jgi:hypothetical protein
MNTLIENNKLIAEFLGIEIEEGQERIYINGLGTKLIECTFNTNWNWLMPVIRKIEELGNDVLITTNYIQIAFDEGEQFIVIDDLNIKIDSVYNAVVEFINWYNKQ